MKPRRPPFRALPTPPHSSSLKAISRPPSRMSSKSRLFVFLIDLLDLRRPGILPDFFMTPKSGHNVRRENIMVNINRGDSGSI